MTQTPPPWRPAAATAHALSTEAIKSHLATMFAEDDTPPIADAGTSGRNPQDRAARRRALHRTTRHRPTTEP